VEKEFRTIAFVITECEVVCYESFHSEILAKIKRHQSANHASSFIEHDESNASKYVREEYQWQRAR